MKQIIEIIAGLFVLIVAFGFLFFSYRSVNMRSSNDDYHLIAKFTQSDGINIGSDIRISGVKIGHVTKQYLDLNNFKAVIELSLDPMIKLPIDSSAQIVSDGLLGAKYLSITVGADDQILRIGQEIKYTQSSVNLETLIGKMIFNNQDRNIPSVK